MPSPDSYTDKILQELEANENGFFQIENKVGKAYLRVTKGGAKGKRVDLKDVISRIKLFGVEDYDTEQIKKLILLADGRETEIGHWSKGQPEDSYIDIHISEDSMSAKLILYPPKHGGELMTEHKLRETIASQGISVGIIDSVLQSLIREPIFHSPIEFAKGLPPVLGRDGEIKLYFRSENKPNLEEDEHGRIDYKNIAMIQSVKENTLLAEIIPPKQGSPGRTVKSESLEPPHPKSVSWIIGNNVEEKDGKLFSKIAGRPVLDKSGEIRVDEVINLEAVDYSTGNVDFPGTIIVEQKIGDGFSLNTNGSIIVNQSVGKAFLKAKGDIVISGGFMGRGEGFLESDSNVYVKFVEQGKISAGGSIFIEEASMHSELSAKDMIQASGGRGELIGGTIIAANSIVCQKLGAVVETKTKLAIGTPPELLEELNRMKLEINEKGSTLKKVQLTIQKLVEQSQKKELKEDEKDMLLKLKEANEKYSTLLETLQKQFDTALGSFEPNKAAYVEIQREMFPGVEISFGVGKIYRSPFNSMIGKTSLQLGQDGSIQTERMQR
ncbi:hypothetical protein LPTSP4_13140 [Leptospira ryugenii]|uniref:Flagellar Assembly Protein A N-terminal region domain-containing protein n=1 Tax=Leptospira ryugenii TaxID=1917863 RepID=A0A2P2DYU7_9LEPT|nr:FapA family protein [Leptospira ryugenii]GBF49795.1 hypothetical protein LPTSP4_13140 [Leptospira ryugenii]